MAYLKFHDSGDVVHLREYHTMGRRQHDVDTLLDYAFVSKLHTVIEWKAANWIISDMSSNGTWVNGDRLQAYTPRALKQGDTIEIAGSKGIKFDVIDLSMPVDMIYRVDQKLDTLALTENRLLPDEQSPLIELYKCPERHEWYAQRIDALSDHLIELGPFEHNSELLCGDDTWAFFVMTDDAPTVAIESSMKNITDIEFRFDISQNEENTTLTLIQGGQEMDLAERTHHYLLAHLLRWKHAQQEMSEGSAKSNAPGWISCQMLTKELGIDETHMNILVFRARQQITSALVGYSGSSGIFERRRGAIRVGISNFSIYKEGRREI